MKQILLALLCIAFLPALSQDTTRLPIEKVVDSLIEKPVLDSAKLAMDSIAAVDSAAKMNARVLYGTASYYANKFHGRRTANGEIFSQKKLTAACNKLPLGTWIRVTNLTNKRSVVVKVNDRLHKKNKRLVDLTREAAKRLNFMKSGLIKVKVEVLGKKPPFGELKKGQ